MSEHATLAVYGIAALGGTLVIGIAVEKTVGRIRALRQNSPGMVCARVRRYTVEAVREGFEPNLARQLAAERELWERRRDWRDERDPYGTPRRMRVEAED